MKQLFGRAWKVKITPQATNQEITLSDSTWDNRALKCCFQVSQQTMVAYWFADIAIYNSTAAMYQVLQKGDPVTLEAGYEAPGAGLIFKGTLLQPVWEREGDTDFKLTLHCMVGLLEDEKANVQVTTPAGITQADAVRLVARVAQLPPPEYLDPVLEQKKLPRAESHSGPASIFFLGVAIDNGLNMWTSWNGLNIRNLAPAEGTLPEVVYAPPFTTIKTDSKGQKATLIGTPQQTERGVNFMTLLDHEARVGQLVKLENALLKQILVYPGQFQPLLAKDGTFVITGIKHIGDTRGNDWYTQFCCVTPEWPKLFAQKVF